MSESPQTRAPEDAAVAGAKARLTPPDVEAALDDFRRWFASLPTDDGEASAEREQSLDLATLLGHFVALRQEVNLQTRAVRAQQEQNAELVAKLGQAVEALSRPRPEPVADDKARPLLNSLVELGDALLLANREVTRTRESLLPALEAMARPKATETPPVHRRSAGSFWTRWFQPSAPQEAPVESTGHAERVAGALSALVTGYGMSLERVERALRKHGLEPIAAVGQPFDPERMEAMDAVADTGRPAGEVVEEVRRGYLWNGRLFRFAQVRVARG
ncbi:MAG: nucleotide exchange factor GrpE [Gemmataceae bacterium]